MRTSAGLLMVMVLPFVTGQMDKQNPCGPNHRWRLGRDKKFCYLWFNRKYNFQTAQEFCRSQGGRLDTYHKWTHSGDCKKPALKPTEQGGEKASYQNITDATKSCGFGWIFGFGGQYCYRRSERHYNFNDAEAYCQSVGGNLVSIHNAREQKFIGMFKKYPTPTQATFWTGLFRRQLYGKWTWTDGSDVDYTDFYGDSNDQNCVDFYGDYPEGKWNTWPCDTSYNHQAICKKPARQT